MVAGPCGRGLRVQWSRMGDKSPKAKERNKKSKDSADKKEVAKAKAKQDKQSAVLAAKPGRK